MSRATFGWKKKKLFENTGSHYYKSVQWLQREGPGHDEAGVQGGTVGYEVSFLDPGHDHKGICLVLKL